VVYSEIGWLQEQSINIWYDEGISATSAIVVYATHALYQMTREDRVRLLKNVEAFAIDRGRRVDLVLMEAGDADYSQIALHTYLPAGRTTHELAHANPHGRWLRWLDTS
jgi:hypothetical protein